MTEANFWTFVVGLALGISYVVVLEQNQRLKKELYKVKGELADKTGLIEYIKPIAETAYDESMEMACHHTVPDKSFNLLLSISRIHGALLGSGKKAKS